MKKLIEKIKLYILYFFSNIYLIVDNINITGTGKTFYAYVGGQSIASSSGLNVGGYNGGGDSGYDDAGIFAKGDDAAGGGGGASDLRINDNNYNNRIIVAAGGSGASFNCNGAPGGEINGYIYNGSNTNCIASDLVNQNDGNKSGIGQNGVNANTKPGGGGGGGYRGGLSSNNHGIISDSSWKGIANSGSSFISGFGGCSKKNNLAFTNSEMIKGNRTGNGAIIIDIDFLCSDNCQSCTSGTKCVKCFSGFFLYNNACIVSCPTLYYGSSGVCHKCESPCKTCTSKTACTSCADGYYLYNNKCMKVCPSGYFESKENNICKKCQEPCKDCNESADSCLSCFENYLLYDNKCWLSCPPKTVQSGNLCEPCNPSCATCSESTTKCTSCIDNYFLFENKCISHCPNGKIGYKSHCVDCGPPCKTCDTSVDYCTTCIKDFYLYKNKCYAVCPKGTIISGLGCEDCEPQCNTCEEKIDFCVTCAEGYNFYNNGCYANCSELDDDKQHFGKNDENNCQLCEDTNCIDCSDYFSYCSQCSDLYYADSGVCIHKPTTVFTESSAFSNSQDFTFSSKFSSSSPFTDSSVFTKSLTFTPPGFTYPPPTDNFTKSEYFSESKDFTRSSHFTESSGFSASSGFSKSEKFTKSSRFTKSSGFTKSSDFSMTSDFSKSSVFTQSFDFSMSKVPETYPDLPVCYAYVDKKNITIGDRCYYLVYDEKYVLIHVISANFSDFKNVSHGGAVYVINCEVEANDANFTNCVSVNGGGGAIYVKNSKNLVNHIRLENLFFTECKAVYGGAVCIYSSDETNNVTILNCTFISNKASSHSSASDNGFLGGGAVFVTFKQCYVFNCKFMLNKGHGGAFKIYNKFDQQTTNLKKLGGNDENSFIINGCQFDHYQKAKSAIYLDGAKEGTKIQINQCVFHGKLNNGVHYIDGNFVGNQASPEIKIQSCDFDYKMEDAVNSKFLVDSIHNRSIVKSSIAISEVVALLFASAIIVAISLWLVYYRVVNSMKNKNDIDVLEI